MEIQSESNEISDDWGEGGKQGSYFPVTSKTSSATAKMLNFFLHPGPVTGGPNPQVAAIKIVEYFKEFGILWYILLKSYTSVVTSGCTSKTVKCHNALNYTP